MATVPHRPIMNPTQNHFELSVRKSLFHLFDYYFDGKQELGLPEMNPFEAFYSCETRRLLPGVCAEVEGKQDTGLQLTFYGMQLSQDYTAVYSLRGTS